MKYLSYYAQVLIEDELWISNIRFNGLFRIEIKTGKISFVGKFPRHNQESEELHLFAKKYGNKICFFPKRSKGIDIYNLQTQTFTYVECETGRGNSYATAVDSFYFDENVVVIVPCYLQTPLQEFSLEEEKIIRSIELRESNQYVQNETNTRSLYACKAQGIIFYPIHGTNKVGSYFFNEKKEKIYSIQNLKKIQGDCIFDGKNLWINADQGIYQWNPFEGNLKFVCDCSSEKEGWIEQFILYGQKMVCIPRWLNHIKIIDRKSLTQQEVNIDKSELSRNIDMPWRDVRESIIWKDTLLIFPVKYRETICVNLKNYMVVYKKWESLKNFPEKKTFFINEKEEKDLRNYIDMVDKKFFSEKENKFIGYCILDKLKTV